MNRKTIVFYFFLWTLLLWSGGIYAQETYYYYDGKKEILRVDRGKLTITSRADFKKVAPKGFTVTGAGAPVVAGAGKLRLQASEIITGRLHFESVPSEDQYKQEVLSLKRNKDVFTVQPHFLTPGNDSVGMSSYLYVKLKDSTDYPLLERMAADRQVVIVRQNKYMPLWYVLSCTSETPLHALDVANTMYESGLFAAASPDFISTKLHSSCANDADYASQWGLNNTSYTNIDINICAAWELAQGEGVKVAIVDTGVQMGHEDLVGNISSLSYDVETGEAQREVIYSDDGHGTAVAGIVGAVRNNNLQIAGVAPKCTIMPVKCKFKNDPFDAERAADAINWAWRNGADVINNSWGSSTSSELVKNAIEEALQCGRDGKGTVVVFSAGNDGKDSVSYPGRVVPGVIVVGAITREGYRKSGTNYGSGLDLMAPGEDIPTLALSSFEPVARGNTSMAAPHVSGVAALILSRNPYLTGTEVRNIMEITAERIHPATYGYTFFTPGHPNGRWSKYMGYGLVNAGAAVQEACTYTFFVGETNVNDSQTVKGCNIYTENVTLLPGAKLTLEAREVATVDSNFVVSAGAELIIK